MIASFAGVVMGFGTLIFLITMLVIGISKCSSSSDEGESGTADVKPNSVIRISLDQELPELTDNVASQGSFSLEDSGTPGLRATIKALEYAKTDSDIKGIYMDLETQPMGAATRSSLRNALLDFKKSGKFIIAYSTRYSQGSYYMASVADKVYLNPQGSIEWAGIAAQIPFFKGMFDKLGISAQVYYAGKFKSATEPFRRTEMSSENKVQVREYMEANYQMMLSDIAASRKMEYSELRHLADEFIIRTPYDALSHKMVDGLKYKDEILTELRKLLKLTKKDKINSIELADYVLANPEKAGSGDGEIALVYAEGSITDGKSDGGGIGGDTYSALFRKLREDEDVKAIVLRVNSGGGSALASELMWRELELCKQEKKTVIVSMGDVAASGGYYIAANADKIFAENNTITGSIGVFGMIPNAGKFMREKLGITYDTLKTGKYSVAAQRNIYYEFNESEGAIIQQMIDSTYHNFLTRVANGRKMTVEQVNEIAQGRVWTGKKALELHLVDSIGGLQDAINTAATFSKLKKYKLAQYPKPKKPLEILLNKLKGGTSGDDAAKAIIRQQLGDELFQQFLLLERVRKMSGVQMRMPFEVILN
ncbi:MAG: signal peptide peptidase SppA, type [Bacteroidota bacterium]